MSLISLDPQAIGWEDDGSDSGVVRTRLLRGDLVEVPFRSLQFYAELAGGATATYQSTGVYSNPDGSGTGINVSVPPGVATGAGVRLWLPFSGRAFGVRWRRDRASMAAFSVAVDGQAVPVASGLIPRLVAEGLTTQITDAQARAVTHDALPDDGPHLAELAFVSDPGATSTVTVYGVLLDSRVGYRQLPRVGQVVSTTVLTASAVEIPANRGNVLTFRSLRKVIYANTTAGAITVTVKNGANTIWAKSIAANDTAELDFGGAGLAPSAAYTHQASAAASVNATVIGEY